MRITPVPAALGLAVLLGTAACGGADRDRAHAGGKGPIAVEATDTACKVARTEAAAGHHRVHRHATPAPRSTSSTSTARATRSWARSRTSPPA